MTLACKTADLLSLATHTLNRLMTGQHTLLCADERKSALAQLAATVQTAAKLADVAYAEVVLTAQGGAATVGRDTESTRERIRDERGRVRPEVVREAERAVVEQIKVEAEKVSREFQKSVAETKRLHAEVAKVRGETERTSAEVEKVERERERAVAETERLKAEAMLVRSEKMKIDAETERVKAETERMKVEAERSVKEREMQDPRNHTERPKEGIERMRAADGVAGELGSWMQVNEREEPEIAQYRGQLGAENEQNMVEAQRARNVVVSPPQVCLSTHWLFRR